MKEQLLLFFLLICSLSSFGQMHVRYIDSVYAQNSIELISGVKKEVVKQNKQYLFINYYQHHSEIRQLQNNSLFIIEQFDRNFKDNNTAPESTNHYRLAEKYRKELSSLKKRINQLSTILSLAKTSYNLCANNVYNKSGCRNEKHKYDVARQNYNNAVSEEDEAVENANYYAKKYNNYLESYKSNFRSYESQRASKVNELTRKINLKQEALNASIKAIDDWVLVQDVETVNYDENYKVKSKGYVNIETGNKVGNWVYYYPNQEIKFKGEFLNNQHHGPWVFYHKNGKVKSEGSYSYGEAYGVWRVYKENGELLTSINY